MKDLVEVTLALAAIVGMIFLVVASVAVSLGLPAALIYLIIKIASQI